MRTASGHETNCFTCGAPPLFFPAGGLLNTRTQAMFKMIWHSDLALWLLSARWKKVGGFGDAFPLLRPWFQAQRCGPKFCDILEGIVHSRSTQRVDTRCDFQRFCALSGTTSTFEDCLLAWLRQKKLPVALQTSEEQRRNLKGEKRGAPTSAN